MRLMEINNQVPEQEAITVEYLFSDIGVFVPPGIGEMKISGIEYDSRKVKPGSIFVAMPGHRTDGAKFICDAVERGAVLVVSEHHMPCDVPIIECAPARRVLAELSAKFYGNPSTELLSVGVTGTNGKSTVCSMMKSILEKSGRKSAQFGTLGYDTGNRYEKAVNTTPESRELQRLLKESLDNGCEAAVFEVSSHALVMYRVHGVDFDLGIFTNLTSEHLDYHKDLESYFSAKMVLFEMLAENGKLAAVNIDDDYGRRITELQGLDIVTFGEDAKADVFLDRYELSSGGSEFVLNTPYGEFMGGIAIPGKFNIQNAMASVAAGIHLDIIPDDIRDGLAAFIPPVGRMQRIDCGQDFSVFIDYAHTPDALDRMLSAVRGFTEGRVIVVFGCGGDKDKTKRAPMARAVADNSDISVITSDNPRTEDPEKIMDEMENGFPSDYGFYRQADREKAIKQALDIAEKGDTVIIAGKGHEGIQDYGDRVEPFSEIDIVKSYFKDNSRN
ncbi:MAG: UDP-N-acetylmuramoyl-L-alanyl-D-glutamate--2,6-diaminopimelate ligase [candidate division Zixibacteria bacterium]|nr:UDP-N-acetylmuramoyl-L-alanyl-D-glutamate--2,6-diaminopimelate ligase [candidate division Zixibacteria bacterium]